MALTSKCPWKGEVAAVWHVCLRPVLSLVSGERLGNAAFDVVGWSRSAEVAVAFRSSVICLKDDKGAPLMV